MHDIIIATVIAALKLSWINILTSFYKSWQTKTKRQLRLAEILNIGSQARAMRIVSEVDEETFRQKKRLMKRPKKTEEDDSEEIAIDQVGSDLKRQHSSSYIE